MPRTKVTLALNAVIAVVCTLYFGKLFYKSHDSGEISARSQVQNNDDELINSDEPSISSKFDDTEIEIISSKTTTPTQLSKPSLKQKLEPFFTRYSSKFEIDADLQQLLKNNAYSPNNQHLTCFNEPEKHAFCQENPKITKIHPWPGTKTWNQDPATNFDKITDQTLRVNPQNCKIVLTKTDYKQICVNCGANSFGGELFSVFVEFENYVTFPENPSFDEVSRDYCFEYNLPEESKAKKGDEISIKIYLQRTGEVIESFRRISNSMNGVAVQYKTMLKIDDDSERGFHIESAVCDHFPMSKTRYNLTENQYLPFYCSCSLNEDCQSKQCKYEMNPDKGTLKFGPICKKWDNAEDGEIQHLSMKNVESVSLLFDKTAYDRWLNKDKSRSLLLLTHKNTDLGKYTFALDKNPLLKKDLLFLDAESMNLNMRVTKPLPESSVVHFIGDSIIELVFREFITLALLDDAGDVISTPDVCEGQGPFILKGLRPGFNLNTWNEPKTVSSKVTGNRKVVFSAHGLPQLTGGCMSHYKPAVEQIPEIFESSKRFENCYIIVGLGNQFNAYNPSFFMERLLEIKRSALNAENENSEYFAGVGRKCRKVFITQPYTCDGGHWPMYGISWMAKRQADIAKSVFEDTDWEVLDTFALSSYFLKSRSGFGGSKIPVEMANILAQMVMQTIEVRNSAL